MVTYNWYGKGVLTHWGRVTHICASKLTIIGSDNGLSPGRRQAIIWTNDGILLNRTLGTTFSDILGEIHSFSFSKMHLKMSSAKWRLFGLGLNELMHKCLWSHCCFFQLLAGTQHCPDIRYDSQWSLYLVSSYESQKIRKRKRSIILKNLKYRNIQAEKSSRNINICFPWLGVLIRGRVNEPYYLSQSWPIWSTINCRYFTIQWSTALGDI